LVIEHDVSARRALREVLAKQSYQVWEAGTKRAGLELFQSHPSGAILLELGLPDGDGLELIDEVRDRSRVPILVVSARHSERDKVEALDRGANDYVVKPFREAELLARLRVALRSARGLAPARTGLEIGPLRLQPLERRAYLRDKEVPLSPTEFSVLHVMARRAGHVVTHAQLLREIWGADNSNAANYLRFFIHQLRQKLERNPTQPELLLTLPRVGYKLRALD
jgi:two-component system KDP operon response regulator KdpE